MMHNGYRVIESDKFVLPDGEEKVKRSIKEMLFSIPWHPFTRFKTVCKYKPSNEIILNELSKTLIMHPKTANKIREMTIESTKKGEA